MTDGLFDDAAVRRVVREGVLPVGGGCATILQIVHELLYPRNLSPVLRPTAPVNRFVTVGLLPDQVRRQLGQPWSPRQDRVLRAGLRVGAVVCSRLPPAVRQAPKTYYLGVLRKQVARRRPVAPVSGGPK